MADPIDELVAAVRERARREDEAGPPVLDESTLGLPPGMRLRTIRLPFGSAAPPPPARRPPAGDVEVAAAERALGFALPPLLRRLYLEVGDGGFGPGDGLLPLSALPDQHRSYAVELAEEQDLGAWPAGLLPVADLDESLIACVDCTTAAGRVVGFDTYDLDLDEGEGWDEAFAERAPSLEAWLREWLASPTPQEAFDAAIRGDRLD